MKIDIKQIIEKLKNELETLMAGSKGQKKTNKRKFRKKIKISPFLFFGGTGAVVVFLLFNLVLMPVIEKKSSGSDIGGPIILRVVEPERHFNKGEVQTQFNLRKIAFSTEVVDNGSVGTPIENDGTLPVVPTFPPALRPNPFD